MAKSANAMVSNTIVRKDLWVQFPPAAPMLPECRADPPDPGYCVDPRNLEAEYVHLLGVYLGDGTLTPIKAKRLWKLRLFQDLRYPHLISAWEHSALAVSGRRVTRVQRIGCMELVSAWKHWICLFPQHGAGPKHLRPIELTPWQINLVEYFPREFVKGLVESDGCRVTNWARARGVRYEYPRYFFTNASDDIRALFQWACSLISVESRQSNARNISVARRRSVALLDEFIGPKR